LVELSSPLPLMCHPSPLSLSWLAEGLCRSEDDSTTARRSAAGIPDRIQTDLLPQSQLDLGPKGVIVHGTCMSTTRCCTCCTMSLCRCCRTSIMAPWCCGVQIFTTLRSATSSSSSTPVRRRNPRDRSMRVRHRSPLIVTTLLLDRSWAIRGYVANIFLLFVPNPNTWSQRS
jgi:hypothetical protein